MVCVAGEGNRGYRRRLKAWFIRHGIELPTLPAAESTRPTDVLNPDVIVEWRDYVEPVTERIGKDNPYRFYKVAGISVGTTCGSGLALL